MTLLEFKDSNGNVSSMFSLLELEFIYSHWDFEDLEGLEEKVDIEINQLEKRRNQLTNETLVKQSGYVIYVLQKFKRFLSEGKSRGHCVTRITNL